MDRALLVAALDLDACLFPYSFIRFSDAVLGPLLEGERHCRKPGNGSDAPFAQLLLLDLTNPRDEAEMIVAASGAVALLPPAAHLALLHPVGVGFQGARCLCHATLELRAHETVVRAIIQDEVGFCWESVAGHNHMHVLRQHSLGAAKQVGV